MSFGADGVYAFGFHLGDPNHLAQDLQVLHCQYSANCKRETGNRAPYRDDRYVDRPVFTAGAVMDALRERLLAPDTVSLILGRFRFDGRNHVLMRDGLLALGLDADTVDHGLEAIAAGFDGDEPPQRSSLSVDEQRAQLEYDLRKAAAVSLYVSSSFAWRNGDESVAVPPEMFAPHVMAKGRREIELRPMRPSSGGCCRTIGTSIVGATCLEE